MSHNIICKINIMNKLYMSKQINLEIEEIVADEIIFDYQRLIKMFDGEKNIPLRKNTKNTTLIPNTNIPNTNIPNTNIPNTNIPNINIPNTNIPTTNIPTTNIPTTNIPNNLQSKKKEEKSKKKKFILENIHKKREILSNGIFKKNNQKPKMVKRAFLMRLNRK